MKRLFQIMTLLLLTPLVWAQNGFDQGNQFYQKEQYAQAVTAYESVLAAGKVSADVYFNLGNAYYKQNKVAPAIFNYEKALQLRPGDREIEANLGFAQKMTIDEIKEVQKVGFEKLLRDFTASQHYDGWAWFAVAFSFGILLCFLGYYFSQTTLLKRVFFVGMFLMVFFSVVSILAAIFEKTYDERERPAIVFAEAAQVKNEPRMTGSDVFTLHEGTKVMVLEKTANWFKIELPDGSAGWIESQAVREIK